MLWLWGGTAQRSEGGQGGRVESKGKGWREAGWRVKERVNNRVVRKNKNKGGWRWMCCVEPRETGYEDCTG